MKDVAATPTADVCRLLNLLHAARKIEERLEDALGEVGLSLAKMGVLAKLADADEPIPLSLLAERCACVRSNITQLVDRLEDDGLVRREPDPDDRRSIRATLTAEGRERHLAGRDVLVGEVSVMVERIGGEFPTAVLEAVERLGDRAK